MILDADKVKCEKCGNIGCKNYLKDYKKLEPPIKTMEEAIKDTGRVHAVTAIMVYNTWILECNKCGYKKEYTA